MNIATVIEFIESMVKSATVSNVDGAYGSGMASGTASFDILSFIKKPQVVLRIVSIVFAFSNLFFLFLMVKMTSVHHLLANREKRSSRS